jgi:ferredoxin, 2Fe-2S
MATITVLPHPDVCPAGMAFDAEVGKSLCRNLLEHGVPIEHACEMSAACTTCHVIVKQGFDKLEPSEDIEDDLLDMAWGLTPRSRLSCQAIMPQDDLVLEIPKYSINHAKENG